MEIVRDCFPSHSCVVVGFVRCTALDFSIVSHYPRVWIVGHGVVLVSLGFVA